MKVFKILFLALVTLLSTQTYAANLTVQNGELMGATDVNVGGSLYDVSFTYYNTTYQNGTCIDVFGGCNSTSDFIFQNFTDATQASQALLDQVFVDGAKGNFDSNPLLTAGCSYPAISCTVLTPYKVSSSSVFAATAINGTSDATDTTGLSVFFTDDPINAYTGFTYAVWSLSAPTPVPLPGSGPLFFLGLMGLSAVRMKK